MLTNPPALTPRLLTIANEITNCNCFADIGTDHAYLPVYMCITKRCNRAIASDINKGPLMRAEKTVLEYGLSDYISLRLGGGLDSLEENEADAVVIAGMGGLLIANILDNGILKLKMANKIIIQPMSSIPELREHLYNKGWKITKESLAKEDEKIYNIITIEAPDDNSVGYTPTSAELFVGKYLIENKPEYFEEYLEKQINKVRNMTDGLKLSNNAATAKKNEYYTNLLNELENM